MSYHLHNSYGKVNFQSIKKLIKYFLNFFLYVEMTNNHYKKTKERLKKKQM